MNQAEEQYIRRDSMNEKEINIDLLYIKNFSKITVRKVCKRLGIDESNVLSGTASKENIKRVRRTIENDIKELSKDLYGTNSITL